MTPLHGSVLGTTKIVDNGPLADRWNIFILSEGYQLPEIPQFEADANAFIAALQSTAPFDNSWCGMNIFRINVESDESGADDRVDCPDEPGTGANPQTYFDAHFCYNNTRRLLVLSDNAVAINVVKAEIPEYDENDDDVIVVIVNTPNIHGGSGGGSPIVVFSNNANGFNTGIHELGHAPIFGLADEYDYDDCVVYSDSEPDMPNITIDTNPATIKWSDLIELGTAMPTRTSCPLGPAPAAGIVGTFEGAHYKQRAIYRPQEVCRMRFENLPFCAVCQRRIRQQLAPYVTLAASVTLTTPSLSFLDIPEGRGSIGIPVHRDIIFEVMACNITLRVTVGPTGGFGTPGSTETIASPGVPGKITISYTSTNAGDSIAGTVTVEAVETGQSWDIDLFGNTVPRPIPAACLVLDRSGSMAGLAGGGIPKITKLRDAAGAFVDLMEEGDGIGIVTFNHEASENLAVTDVGPNLAPPVPDSGRAIALNLFDPANSELTPGGTTSIGDGVFQGKQSLDAVLSDYGLHAMLVLTDGNENTPLWLDDVGGSITSRTFAVGLGKAADVSTLALNKLTQNTGGYLLITGEIGSDQSSLLSKYFIQILAGITNAEVILDPSGYLLQESKHRIPFFITEAEYSIDVIMISPMPRAIGFYLETPAGQIIDPSQAANVDHIKFVSTDRVSFYRLALPPWPNADLETYIGTWHAILLPGHLKHRVKFEAPAVEENRATPLPYDLIVHAHSNLKFKATVQQNSLEPEADITIRASLTEYGLPLTNQATVWAEITNPNSNRTDVSLEEFEGGQFASTFKVGGVGDYHIRVRAQGITLNGTNFQREQQRTAVSFVGGDDAPMVSMVPDGLLDEAAERGIGNRLKKWCLYLCLAAIIMSMMALLLVIISLLSS